MKTLLLFITLVAGCFVTAQKYSTKNGKVHFEASVPLFEDVDATNSAVAAAFNADTGDIASAALTKNFKFKVALMEEHFNENYAESAKYPKVTFSGKIAGFNKALLSSTPTKYTISGTLNFHGVPKPVSSVANIWLKDGKLQINGTFVVRPADYNVTIPKVVTKKIAENVNVDYNFELTAK